MALPATIAAKRAPRMGFLYELESARRSRPAPPPGRRARRGDPRPHDRHGRRAAQQQPPFRSGAKTVAVLRDRHRQGRPARTGSWRATPSRSATTASPSRSPSSPTRSSRSASSSCSIAAAACGATSGSSSAPPRSSSAASVPATRHGSAPSPIGFDIAPERSPRDQGRAVFGFLRSNLPITGSDAALERARRGGRRRARQEGRKVVLVFSDGGDSPMNIRFDNRSIIDVMRGRSRTT